MKLEKDENWTESLTYIQFSTIYGTKFLHIGAQNL